MSDKSVRGGVVALPSPPVITLTSKNAGGPEVYRTGTIAAASGVNPFAANELLAFPFTLTAPVTRVNKAWWYNGSSTGANAAVAIYDADFVKITQTASTAQSGASAPQAVSMPANLGPGLYYCALAASDATNNRWFRWSVTTTGAGFWKMVGCWRQASITIGSLPSPATPVACANVGFPAFGLTTRTFFDL